MSLFLLIYNELPYPNIFDSLFMIVKISYRFLHFPRFCGKQKDVEQTEGRLEVAVNTEYFHKLLLPLHHWQEQDAFQQHWPAVDHNSFVASLETL